MKMRVKRSIKRKKAMSIREIIMKVVVIEVKVDMGSKM